MPLKNIQAHCKKYGKKYGPYWAIEYASGSRFVWKRGWKKGMDIPKDEKLARAYREQQTEGHIKESLLGYIAARAIFECGRLSRKVGREVLGLPAVDERNLSQREIVNRIIEYWRPRRMDSGNYALGEEVPDNQRRVIDLMRDKPEVYKYTTRHKHSSSKSKGFKAFLETVFPGLYTQVSYRRMPLRSNEKEELKAELIRRFNSGLGISPSYLTNSPERGERELYRKVMDIEEEDLFGFKRTYVQRASSLTGLAPGEIKLDTGAKTNSACLTELFTDLVFRMSALFGEPVFGIDPKLPILDKRTDLEFLHHDHEHRADLRIGNIPIEVKNYIAVRFCRSQRADLLEKYTQDNSVWKNDGARLEKGKVIFHCPERAYASIEHDLEKEGLKIVPYETFHRKLRGLFDRLRETDLVYRENLEYLLELHEEISLSPFLIVREGNRARRRWSTFLLREIIKTIEESSGRKV